MKELLEAQMKELLEWTQEKEAEIQKLVESLPEGDSESDYAQGLYEAYGVVVSKIQKLLGA